MSSIYGDIKVTAETEDIPEIKAKLTEINEIGAVKIDYDPPIAQVPPNWQ